MSLLPLTHLSGSSPYLGHFSHMLVLVSIQQRLKGDSAGLWSYKLSFSDDDYYFFTIKISPKWRNITLRE